VTEKSPAFLTNQFGILALSVCALYKRRHQVRIKRSFGASENAVKITVVQ
jgi:hypothetical protein